MITERLVCPRCGYELELEKRGTKLITRNLLPKTCEASPHGNWTDCEHLMAKYQAPRPAGIPRGGRSNR